MNVLIIEDEPLAAQQLKELIGKCCSDPVFYPVIDSVDESVSFLRTRQPVDIIFVDIHLSDGHAFEIFDVVQTDLPVIFTTSYDHYAIRAFEVNSIDYLLKPISIEQLQKAMAKFATRGAAAGQGTNQVSVQQLQKLLTDTSIYRENLLVSVKDKLLPVPVRDVAWFEIKNGVVLGTRFDRTVVVSDDRSLDDLATTLNPRQFYRANRQYLVNKLAIKEIAYYFNGKLKVVLQPSPNEAVIISREKASGFKQWMSV